MATREASPSAPGSDIDMICEMAKKMENDFEGKKSTVNLNCYRTVLKKLVLDVDQIREVALNNKFESEISEIEYMLSLYIEERELKFIREDDDSEFIFDRRAQNWFYLFAQLAFYLMEIHEIWKVKTGGHNSVKISTARITGSCPELINAYDSLYDSYFSFRTYAIWARKIYLKK